MTLTKSSVRAKIEPLGIEYIEDEKFIESTYDASDTFSIEEKIAIIERIDKLSEELKVIKLAQEFTYNDLYDELEELKVLLSVLGKKNWTQILKGKMVDAGLGLMAKWPDRDHPRKKQTSPVYYKQIKKKWGTEKLYRLFIRKLPFQEGMVMDGCSIGRVPYFYCRC